MARVENQPAPERSLQTRTYKKAAKSILERLMASAENRFRKIEIRMWTDQKFRKLSPMPPSGQSLWVYLLSGPHTGIIPGLSKARRGGIADELAWTLEAFDSAFKEITSQQMAEADWQAGVVWIPNAIKCNPPQSPNVITAWRTAWPLIPECDLKTKALEAMRSIASEWEQAYCDRFSREFGKPSGKPSAKPSRKPSAKAMSNQEQEQLAGTGNMEQGTGFAVPELKKDRSELIELIARTYPGNKTLDGLMVPHIMEKAIGDAIDAHGDKVLAGTKAYAAAVAKFPPHKRQFIPTAEKWFTGGKYNTDPAEWVEVKPGETPVNRYPLQSGLDAHERTMRDLLEAD